MLYKVFLSIFLISTTSFIMWVMFTINIGSTDYKKEPVPVQLRRYLEARVSEVTTHRSMVTRNDSFYQTGITRIVSDLKREFLSKNYTFMIIFWLRQELKESLHIFVRSFVLFKFD